MVFDLTFNILIPFTDPPFYLDYVRRGGASAPTNIKDLTLFDTPYRIILPQEFLHNGKNFNVYIRNGLKMRVVHGAKKK
jgi:hypothetical protein